MIRIITLLLVSVAVFSTAEEIQFRNCIYPHSEAGGPSSASLIKTDNGFELEIKFWANDIGPNSPLKIQRSSYINYLSTNRLVYVFYPIQTASASDKYTEHTITLSIPKTKINSDEIQFSLHKVDKDGHETTVWCMMASVKALNGMKEERSDTVEYVPAPQPSPLLPSAGRPVPAPVPYINQPNTYYREASA